METVYNGIMGLVVGDALGVPVEFRQRDTYKITDMTGYGTYNQPSDTWSDDSSLTLATMESIIRKAEIDPADIIRNFSRWLNYAEFTPYGKVFDMGSTTERVIRKFDNQWITCGCGRKKDNGNGSLMRILPLALFPSSLHAVDEVSSLTHSYEISKRACRLHVGTAEQLLNGKSISDCIRYPGIWVKEFNRIPQIYKLNRDEIRSTGYVVDTLETALWCVYNTNTYRDCVLETVNLGGDTDTIAAVVGGLAGIIYGCGGEKGIPDEWIAQIARREWIE